MTKNPSKILITGSTGFVGYNLVHKLLQEGECDLRCFARPGSNIEKLRDLQKKYPKAYIDIFIGNLNNQKDAQKCSENIKLIYHCAAGMQGPIASLYLNTVIATKNLLEAVVENKNLKRFVLISSFAVYGVGNFPKGTIVTEKTPLETNLNKRNDAYTYTKLKQEILVWTYQKKYNLPVVVVRPGVIYGPGGGEISRRVGVNLLGYFLNIGKSNILPLSYIENCVDSIILAGKISGIEGQTYNIHDDDLCTCNEFLKQYLKQVKKMKTIKIPYSLFWIFSLLVDFYSRYSKGQIPAALNTYKTSSVWKGNKFDNSKLKKELNWRQNVSTKEGLEKHFKYYRELYSNVTE